MENVNKDKQHLAIGYCRVSTDDQSKNGLSIDVQEKVCRAAMEEDGFTVLDVIKDEGKSGGSLKRKGIQEVIQLVSKQKVQAVYTVHSDRIARNTLDYLGLRQLFREHGVVLKCLYQPMTDDSATSRTMDTVVASFNEMQRLVTSEKVKDTLYSKAEAGYFPSVPPPGYKNIDNPNGDADRLAKKLVVQDPETAPLIKELFGLYATGNFNVYDLQEIMHEKGLRSRTGGKMSPSRIYDLLRNKFYLGEVHWGKIHNKNGKHQALIDEYLFHQVQSVLDARNSHACRRRKYTWLLGGFLYCFKHSKRYTAEWHLKKKIAYYHCTNRNGCGKYAEQVQLEDKVAEKFKELEFNPDFVNKIIEKVKTTFYERRKSYEGKRQALINRKTAYEARKKVMEDKLFSGVISDEDFTSRRQELNTELASIDEQLNELGQKQKVRVDIAQEILLFTRHIYKAYKKASPTLKRHQLSFFWKKFEVADGVIIKSHPTLLFEELLRLEQVMYKNQENENPPIIGGIRENESVIITAPGLRG